MPREERNGEMLPKKATDQAYLTTNTLDEGVLLGAEVK